MWIKDRKLWEKMGNLIIERKVNLKYLLIRISNSELWTVEWKYVHNIIQLNDQWVQFD